MYKEKTTEQTLALNGGPKAVTEIEGKSQPKIGVDEFMSLAERFGFSPAALDRIRSAVSNEDLGPGPNLARYATAYPKAPKGLAFEALARELFGVKYSYHVCSLFAICSFLAPVKYIPLEHVTT